MIISMWILAIVFSSISLAFVRKFFLDSMNLLEIVMFVLSVFISAFSIGVIQAGSLAAYLS